MRASLLAKVVSRLTPTVGVTQILGCGKAKAGEFRHCPGLLQYSLFPLIGIYIEGIAQLLLDPYSLCFIGIRMILQPLISTQCL